MSGHRFIQKGTVSRDVVFTANLSAGVMCPTLSAPANGQVMWTGLTPDSTATYTCDVVFELNGVQTRTCQNDGTWSDDPPTCERTYIT